MVAPTEENSKGTCSAALYRNAGSFVINSLYTPLFDLQPSERKTAPFPAMYSTMAGKSINHAWDTSKLYACTIGKAISILFPIILSA